MKLNKNILFILLLVLWVSVASAAFVGQSFKKVADFSATDIRIPKLLEFKIKDPDISSVVVYDVNSDKFIPSLLIERNKNRVKSFVVSGGGNNPDALFDNDLQSVSEFPVDGETMKRSEILIEFNPPAEFEGVVLALDKNVRLPNYVSVYDVSNAKILLSREPLRSEFISFPRTRTKQLAIRFKHIQPLRIAEIKPLISKQILDKEKRLRFLAKPGAKYKIFANPAYSESLGSFEEAPDFYDTEGMVHAGEITFKNNPAFKEPDTDHDGIIDKLDNCVFVSNTDQKDTDKNERGDACDDFDKDGVINSKDNCPNTPNYNQSDKDRDGIGDACDKEESRFFEKNKWLIWVAIVFVFALFAMMTYFIWNNSLNTKRNSRDADTDENDMQ